MNQIIKLTGRLDTANASAFDAQIAKEITAQTTAITFDCSELEYISSTGLRIVLKYKKQFPELEVVNVSPDVYNVFEMTGFSRILTVKKALRKIDLTKCQMLAEGANGAVYKVSDEEIVKICKRENDEELLIEEMNTAREAFVLGVPTMISFDTVEVTGGKRGIVLEALNPLTLSKVLSEHPEDVDKYVKPYVDLFLSTNAITSDTSKFPTAKQHLLLHLHSPKRYISDEALPIVQSLVEALPDGNILVHGDGHPNNVLVSGDENNRSMMLIDMGDLSLAHPLLEVMGWAFLMNSPEYSPARFAVEHATGVNLELATKLYRKMVAYYFKVDDEALLDRIITASASVGALRLACFSQGREKNPERLKVFDRLIDGIVAEADRIREYIKFLTDLLDNRK